MLIGAGKKAESGSDLTRKLAAAAGLAAKQRRATRVAFLIRGSGASADLAQAAAEGLTLAEFDGASYKTVDRALSVTPSWMIVVEGGDGAAAKVNGACARGRILGESSNLARALANEPGNTLTP